MKEETNDLIVVLTGEIIESNLPAFKKNALAVISAADKPLVTTKDFDDAELTIKKCKESETALKAAKEKALNQTVDIKALFETMDEISEALATTRLSLDKRVNERKQNRKKEIVDSGCERFEEAIDATAQDLPEINNAITVQRNLFEAAIHGMRKIENMEKAIDDLLELRIEQLSELKESIEHNKALIEKCDLPSLFPDVAQVVCKPLSEVELIIEGRVAKHKLAEKERKEKEKEAAAAKVQEKEEPLPEPEKKQPKALMPIQKTPTAPKVVREEVKEETEQEGDFVLTVQLLCRPEIAKGIAQSVNTLIGADRAVTKIGLVRA